MPKIPIEPQPIFLYADDGAITAKCQQHGQLAIDTMRDGFLSFGLEFNADKTKFLTHLGGIPYMAQSDVGYRRRISGVGQTHKERALEKVTCPKCQTPVNRQYLKLHMKTQKCKKKTPDNVVIRNEEATNALQNRTSVHYEISFQESQAASACPVPDCPYAHSVLETAGAMATPWYLFILMKLHDPYRGINLNSTKPLSD